MSIQRVRFDQFSNQSTVPVMTP